MRQLLLFTSLLASSPVLAQWEPPDAPAVADDGGRPHVYYAHSYRVNRPNDAGLDDLLSVHVQNFSSLLSEANRSCGAIVLFIDGMALKGLQPQSCNLIDGHVRYRLLRTSQSSGVWKTLLGRPSGYKRSVSISVGVDDQVSVPSVVTSFNLEVIPRFKFFVFFVIIMLGLLVSIQLCRNHGLIRAGHPSVPVAKQPYSLALFQMAFWFFLIITAYLFIWLINDEIDTITDSMLALLGIGAGTALAGTLSDTRKQSPNEGLSGLASPGLVNQRESRGFINDLLTEDGGLSLHRVQLFVWTLILGVIFCSSVYATLEMPEFSATVLALMGLSSGTYLGFGLPKRSKPSEQEAVTSKEQGGPL